MKFNVETIPGFDKEFKALARKYPSLKNELSDLIDMLEETQHIGDRLFSNCFKIRVSIASKGKGKRGGARLITHVKVTKQTVYLLSIYDKSELEDIPDAILKALIKSIPL